MNSKKIIVFLATFFYVGKIKIAKLPKMPGTFGTLAAIPLWYGLCQTGPVSYMICTLGLTIASLFICEWYERLTDTHDNSEVVIDEVVGFLITMVWLPQTWLSLALGFALFRFFDVVKPSFIGHLDRKVKGGVGVVVDDVAAGLVSSILLQVFYAYYGK